MKPRPAFAEPDFRSPDGKAKVAAIKAFAEGTARPDQMILAAQTILDDFCRLNDVDWFPDDFGGERDSSFAAGRRFVGLLIRKVITQPFEALTGKAETPLPRTRKRKG